MKIKMIDLFKLMLERKAPKKIRVLGFDMTFIETAEWGDYKDDDCHRLSEFRLIDCLNEDVEIIEYPKKIEKLEPVRGSDLSDLTDKDMVLKNNALIELCKTLNNMNNKINELIDEINNLKEKKDE